MDVTYVNSILVSMQLSSRWEDKTNIFIRFDMISSIGASADTVFFWCWKIAELSKKRSVSYGLKTCAISSIALCVQGPLFIFWTFPQFYQALALLGPVSYAHSSLRQLIHSAVSIKSSRLSTSISFFTENRLSLVLLIFVIIILKFCSIRYRTRAYSTLNQYITGRVPLSPWTPSSLFCVILCRWYANINPSDECLSIYLKWNVRVTLFVLHGLVFQTDRFWESRDGDTRYLFSA